MKKLVRILSIVMLVAMLMSIMSTGAFALVDSDADVSNGGVTIGGVQRPSNDSAYDGSKNSDGEDSSVTTVAPTEKVSAARVAAGSGATYKGKADNYDGLDNSDLDLVKENNAFLKYIRDYVNEHKTLSNEMTEMVQSAVTIFGEEAIYGTGSSTSANDSGNTGDSSNTGDSGNTGDSESGEPETLEQLKEKKDAAYEVYLAPCDAYKILDELDEEDPEFETKLDEAKTAFTSAQDAYYAAYDAWDAAGGLASLGNGEGSGGASFLDGPSIRSVIPSDKIGDKVESKWKNVCPSSTYNSFAEAIQHRETMQFEKTMDIINSTDYDITLDLNLSTIKAPENENAFYIQGCSTGHDATISFTRGTIEGDGFYVVKGVLNLGGLINDYKPDITIYAKTANCVTVYGSNDDTYVIVAEGATLDSTGVKEIPDNNIAGAIGIWSGNVYVNGGKVLADRFTAISNYDGNLIIEGSSYIDSIQNTGLSLGNGGKTSVEDGSVRGITGIAITGKHTLDISGGHVIGDLPNHLAVASGAAPGTNWALCGNAIATKIDSSYKSKNPLVNVYAKNVLISENNLAIMSFNNDGSNRLTKAKVESMTRVSLIDENCIETEYIAKTGDYSDYNKATVTVNGNGYGSLKAAFEAAASDTTLKDPITIKLLGDYTMTADDAATPLKGQGTKTVIFDGNYHKLTAADKSSSDTYNGITVGSGNTIIRNVTIKDTHANASGIFVNNANANCEIGDNVTVQHFKYGLGVGAGEVLVNDLSVDDASEYGLYCYGGKTTVVMCKINCDSPVYAANTSMLQINGGWFLYEESQVAANAGDAKYKVATYIDSKISHIEYIKADKYYEVLLNDTPIVQVVSGTTGTDTDGKPYVIFDKGDMEKIIFSVSPEVMTIEAVNVYTGVYKPLFNAPAGKKGNVAVQDATMKDLPAGKYDLRFTFKTSNYVIKDKLTLYVYPAVAMLLKQDLTYNSANDIVTSYNVADLKNIAVYMSELPEKIAVGNDASGVNVTYLENYVKSDPDTWQPNFVKSTSAATRNRIGQNYTYILSYADLNNLASGQNYVFLRYGDDAYCAVKRLPLTIYNSAVSITPTSVTWSKINSTLDFTVAPDVQEIYIDDDYVDPGYWKYDPTTGKLSIKGSYFKALPNGDHLMEIITSMGKVAATVKTGAALAPKDVDYHVYGGAKSLSFVASDKIDYDLGITIGSANAVNVDSFIIKDSDTQFTLSANYLNRLALGTYTISAYVLTTDANGKEVYQKCSTTFRVISASQAAYNPGTGDTFNPILWIAILVLSAVVIVVIILPKLKKSKALSEAAVTTEQSADAAEKILEESVEKNE